MLALLRHLHRAKELVQRPNPALQLRRKQGFYKRNGPGESTEAVKSMGILSSENGGT